MMAPLVLDPTCGARMMWFDKTDPRWWLYTRTADHTIPLLAEVWDDGFRLGDGVGTYIAAERDEFNPYRQEPGDRDADLNPSNSMGIEHEETDK